jgi:hypothetical protein
MKTNNIMSYIKYNKHFPKKIAYYFTSIILDNENNYKLITLF